jgi:diguanylate cyclase (GGDEF)-like protein
MKMNEKNKILIVDDDRSLILALNHILNPSYNVFAAKDGQMALDMVKENKPDIILLDVIMPDMTGFEVLQRLKMTEDTRKIPVIFITGLDDADEEEKGFILGAADYITKPFKESIVKARVKTQLQMADYIRQIENFGITDPLTQLPNRRYLDNQMTVEWNRAMREREYLSVFLIDIDFFKKYNDTYGHIEGDRLLQSFAIICKEPPKRSTDVVARWGGEEFIVLLPNTDAQGAMMLAELTRSKIEDAVFVCRDGQATKITVSIGVSTLLPDTSSTIIDFLAKVDKALYNAKNSGRNKVCFEK